MITVAGPIDADALRVRHEFLALPELCLSVDDIAALLHLQQRHASLILESLVREGFLERSSDGRYARAQHSASP